MIKKRYYPLQLQMVFCILLGAVCVVGIYLGLWQSGIYIVEHWYESETAIVAREQALLEEFNTYVQKNHLRSDETEAVGEWAREKSMPMFWYFAAGI